MATLTPENWCRDAKAVDANNNIVGPKSNNAVKFSTLGLVQKHYGYSRFTIGAYNSATIYHGFAPQHNLDKKLTLRQANSILSFTFNRLGFNNE